MKISFQKVATAIGSSALLTASGFCYALPFNIFPAAPLPTQISPGETLKAFYTVQNNTASTRNGNFVKYLPPNVTQITSDPSISNLCGTTFNLTKRGTPGDSCTLELLITGIVNASDPDPHHHLFVCFPGGANCAGTQSPLNVTFPTQQQFAYIPNFNITHSINICAVGSNLTLGPCGGQTDASIFQRPVDVVVNSTGTRAYVLNTDGSGNIESCAINANGTLRNCIPTPSPENVGNGGLRLSPNNSLLYLNTGTNIFFCTINPDFSVGTCTQTSTSFSSPLGRIAFNPSGTFAYVANAGNLTVSSCTVSSGDLINCMDNSLPTIIPLSPSLPVGNDLDTAGAFIYVPVIVTTGSGEINTVFGCQINPDGTFTNCITTNPQTFRFGDLNSSLFISNKQKAYIPNAGSTTVTQCTAINGVLSNCTDTGGFNTPTSVWLTKGK